MTAALSEDALADAIGFMESQLDDDGRQIVVTPQILVVKNARMQMIAQRILNSTQTGARSSTAAALPERVELMDKGTINPLAGDPPGRRRDPRPVVPGLERLVPVR